MRALTGHDCVSAVASVLTFESKTLIWNSRDWSRPQTSSTLAVRAHAHTYTLGRYWSLILGTPILGNIVRKRLGLA